MKTTGHTPDPDFVPTTSDNIYYEQSISDCGDITSPTKEGYVFAGWYADAACTVPYSFEGKTMPNHNIVVYAKWVQKQYRVFLHSNAKLENGTYDDTLNWGSDTQAMNFRVSYNDKISLPEGLRDDYEFVGWYTEDGKLFSEDTRLNDSTVNTPYNKDVDYTDPMNKYGVITGAGTNSDKEKNRFWITEKLDLYAHWRAKLNGAKGINVIYDANGGSNAPKDDVLYLDSANAVAQAASKAPKGKVFKYWVVQKWNGTEYVDTDEKVLPGNEFIVLKKNAKIEDIPKDQQTDPGVTKKYTVQLKAEYVDLSDKKTKIRWHANNGTGEVSTDGPIAFNEAVPIHSALSNDEFEFLGWSRQTVSEDQSFVNEKKPLTEEDLYLTYDEDANTYSVTENQTKLNVKKVAQDTKESLKDLYAVWVPKASITVYKVDGKTKEKLDGAQFKLTKKINGIDTTMIPKPNGKGWVPANSDTDSSTENIAVTSEGKKLEYLSSGSYTLTETKVPDGYRIINEKTEFTVQNGQKDKVSGSNVENHKGEYIVTISNEPGKALPNTGGSGTLPFTAAGAILLITAGAWFALKVEKRQAL